MNLLEVVHPAGRTLVDVAKSQDAEVGDGTTSVVLLAAEILKNCKCFIEEGVHPQIIIKSLRLGTKMAIDKIKEIAVQVNNKNKAEQRSLLVKCAATTLSSKLVAHSKEFFADMVVEAVMLLDELLPLNMIGIKKVRNKRLFLSKPQYLQYFTQHLKRDLLTKSEIKIISVCKENLRFFN